MSNRLKLFRERMAAFEGAANPSEAIESGYYVHAPGKLLVDNISNRIALRPSSSHLLLGGIGSGKTTQLLVACQQINEIEDIHAIYVDDIQIFLK
jgi:type IV secretory pathway ATPase VirB11/archaellum biosynthesis ATPase